MRAIPKLNEFEVAKIALLCFSIYSVLGIRILERGIQY